MNPEWSPHLVLLLSALFIFLLFCVGVYFILRHYFSNKTPDKTNTREKNQEGKVSSPSSLSSPDPRNISLKEALSRSRSTFWGHFTFSQSESLEQHIEQIEEALYMADVGPKTVALLVEKAQKFFKKEKLDKDSLRPFLQKEMGLILKSSLNLKPLNGEFKESLQKSPHDSSQSHLNNESSNNENPSNEELPPPPLSNPSVYLQLSHNSNKLKDQCKIPPNENPHDTQKEPLVLLIVGVNGAGKTTTIGKLSQNLANENKKVLIAAGDTFRAAAGEQLKVWTDRAQAEIFSPEGVKDPSAVAFDAASKAIAKNFDVCIIDTAGRLHTQAPLMSELEKIRRVIKKVIPNAPHHTWIVLDASSGQNALYQAQNFNEKLNLTGAILTKMDGSSKGGIALAIAQELKIPIRYIGVGEKISDLKPFVQKEFIESLI